KLREHYEKFEYYKLDNISSAFNLIARIAVEPDIARYIEQAEFYQDCQCTKGARREIITRSALANENPGEGREEAVIRLLANFSDLKRAGLDWKEYYAAIEEDLNTGRYSQHCANGITEHLRRPINFWTPWFQKLDYQTASLSQVTLLEGNECEMSTEFDIDMAAPFLTLPYLQYFEAQRCKSANSYRNTAGKYAALENVVFRDTHLDEMAVGNFVQHTPNLKSFVYRYSENPGVWDICKMLKEIERGVGSNLEELYMLYESKNTMDEDTGEEMNGSLAPGKASLHGFQRIRRLQLPLEIAVYNHNAARADRLASLIDLVPASVSHLSFISCGTDDEAKTLQILFPAFSRSQVPSLQEFHLFIPGNATELYKQSWAKVSEDMGKAGIL
ncbi:F-box domain protein, partial [Penicillium canescens]